MAKSKQTQIDELQADITQVRGDLKKCVTARKRYQTMYTNLKAKVDHFEREQSAATNTRSAKAQREAGTIA